MRETDRSFGAVTVLIGTKNGKYPDGNSLLVRGRDAQLLIDPSLSVADRAAELGSVDLVVQSHVHEDHVAGLFRFPDAAVHAHRHDVLGLHGLDGLRTIYGYDGLDAAALQEWVVGHFNYAPRPDAQPYDDGAHFDLGGAAVQAMHLPGHTRGHCFFRIEPVGLVYLADVDLSSFGPYYGDAWSDLDDFERTLAMARDIDAAYYATFHHIGVIEGKAPYLERLQRFTGVITDRERRLLDYLAEPRTLDEIVAHRFIYRPQDPVLFADGVERRSMALHIARLARDGRVHEPEPGRYVRAR